jgi:C4-dicarboxylate transporter DctM subunit
VTFGVVMAFNLCLGLVTPPVGACVLLSTSIGKTRLGETMKVIMLPLIIGIVVLLLTTYCAPLTQWLPSLMTK